MLLYSLLLPVDVPLSPIDEGILRLAGNGIDAMLLQRLRKYGCSDAELLKTFGEILGDKNQFKLEQYKFSPLGDYNWQQTHKGGTNPWIAITAYDSSRKVIHWFRYIDKSLINILRWTFRIPKK